MAEQLTPNLILGIIAGYFLVLMAVSYFTGRNTDNVNFFLAGRNSPWGLVAIGMIGATLSGVTLISVPGAVGGDGANQAFSYMQMVFGYLLGYIVIAQVLLPLYYRMNLTSIYSYLGDRLGFYSYKTGAAYFLLSRIIGASFRLYLVSIVLDSFVLGPMGVPFWVTVMSTIILIWVYTFRGGINTIVWTDSLQTICMLVAIILSIISIGQSLETDLSGMMAMINQSGYSKMFFFEGGWSDPNNFFKQFFAGALITIVMTGLDQDMMQKNLTCRSLRDAQKNMYTFSITLIFVNALILILGALLYIYAAHIGLDIPAKSDQLYPTIALQHLPPAVGILFMLGLIAAAYSSADSALTSLTTSFCVDFLNFETSTAEEEEKKKLRFRVHIGVSVVLFLTIILFSFLDDGAVINKLFTAASYTYGPLLGLFTFGMFTQRSLKENDRYVIPVCLLAPLLSFILDTYSGAWFNGFQFGFLILAINGLLTFLGLWGISAPQMDLNQDGEEE